MRISVELTRRPNVVLMTDNIRTTAAKELGNTAGKAAKQQHDNLVRPWDQARDQPDFTVEQRIDPAFIEIALKMEAPTAESAGLSVWQLLNRGTRIRYMQLSDDWSSKTSPGRTSSGPGRGHKTGLDLEDPQPGIEKREFAKNIGDALKPGTDAFVQRAYAKGFKRAFG